MTAPPSPSRKLAIDTLVGALKAGGAWAKADAIYILAAHDAQAALLNWKSASYNATATNTPTFAADSGYTFDGSTNYLDTNFNPSTAGGAFAQDDAYLGMWLFSQADAARSGNTTARLQYLGGNAMSSRGNDGTNSSQAIDAAVRWISWSRSGGASYTQRVDGADLATPAVASTGLTSANLGIGAIPGTTFGQGGIRAYIVGSAMSEAEDSATFSALSTYLGAVGAI